PTIPALPHRAEYRCPGPALQPGRTQSRSAARSPVWSGSWCLLHEVLDPGPDAVLGHAAVQGPGADVQVAGCGLDLSPALGQGVEDLGLAEWCPCPHVATVRAY